MYESFYGLHTKPFSLLPDPDFLYLGAKHSTAMTLLEYGLANQIGFIVMTGFSGTGKTTMLRKMLKQTRQEFSVGVISHTQNTFVSLTPWILVAFGISGKGKDASELFQELSEFLVRERRLKRRVLLVVDEAQNLTASMLEELRLLSNNNDKEFTLQIILSGQPGLRTLLKQANLVQLAQRIGVEYNLEPLGETDTVAYIRHRIQVAGGRSPVFTDVAASVVYRLTD
jgi:general secretion pathway protein A